MWGLGILFGFSLGALPAFIFFVPQEVGQHFNIQFLVIMNAVSNFAIAAYSFYRASKD